MPIQLADFPAIKRQSNLLQSAYSEEAVPTFSVSASAAQADYRDGFRCIITRQSPKDSNLWLDRQNTLANRAAHAAAALYIQERLPEIFAVMREAAAKAEVQAAKDLSQEAIGILTTANQ